MSALMGDAPLGSRPPRESRLAPARIRNEKRICERFLVRSSKAHCPLLPTASITNELRGSSGSNRPLFPPMSTGPATVMATVENSISRKCAFDAGVNVHIWMCPAFYPRDTHAVFAAKPRD